MIRSMTAYARREIKGSWGSAARDPRGWSATHVYFALIAGADIALTKGANAADVAWFDVDELLAALAAVVVFAIIRIRAKRKRKPRSKH